MAKKKKKNSAAAPAPKSETSEPAAESKAETAEPAEEIKAELIDEISDAFEGSKSEEAAEDEIILSSETLEEIGMPDKDQVFKRVAQAYEEAKRKREKYKKIGPIFTFVSGVVFLTLMFTLEHKITFLILWVVTVLYTVALMIRTEYKYHQFCRYLGLPDDDPDEEDTADAEAAEPPSDGSTNDEATAVNSSKAESSENQQEEEK